MERSAQQVLAQIVTVFPNANNTSKVCTDGVASLKNKNKGLFFFAISNRVAWLELQDTDANNRIQSGPLGGGADDVAVTMSAWGSTTSRAMSPPPHPTLFDSFEYQLLPTEEAMAETTLRQFGNHGKGSWGATLSPTTKVSMLPHLG